MTVQLRAKVNRQDVDRLVRSFHVAVNYESARVVRHLAVAGMRNLEKLERSLGHEWLAARWTYRFKEGPNLVHAEVYNTAEFERLYNKTTNRDLGRVRSTRYPVEGARVLAILEGGAKRHPIEAKSSNALTIPLPGTEARARAHMKRNGPGSFLPPTPGDTRFVDNVDHPGVTGNRNVATTRNLLLAVLERTVQEAASRIAVRTSAP